MWDLQRTGKTDRLPASVSPKRLSSNMFGQSRRQVGVSMAPRN